LPLRSIQNIEDYSDWVNNPDNIKFEKLRLTKDGEEIPMRTEVYNDMVMDFFERGTTDEILFTGLASECGEVMSERMKEVRKSVNRTEEIIDELSDVLWFVTVIAKQRGVSLKELMKHNIDKLEDRALNGKR
jgi:NTP pyrophosphatase (non-canonical NTP hydrolase)